MTGKTAFRLSPYLLPALAVIPAATLFDQWTKWLMMNRVLRDAMEGFCAWFVTRAEFSVFDLSSFRVIEAAPFLNFPMVWNTGVSFGILGGQILSPSVFIGMSLLICLPLAWGLVTAERKGAAWGFGLIIGGALGNVFDRWRFGAVVDFLDFHAAGKHWPAFNAADSFVFIGAGLLILDAFCHDISKDTGEKK